MWRAKDTKLGREVAIKTLPKEFAKDADRLARFEREAKLLASLNHPNIAAIHGFEEDNGTHFLVLELVEGDTLADRLNRGAIPVEESLKLALQIADALKAAHDKGVIHRDLKPLNIKVTDDDNVKVLDFGLAKAFAGDEAEASVSNSPTLSMAATQQGVILGTAAYMSPEQAKGRTVDKRTDVWAFGCVLYEMLTGRQSFGASDVTESLAAVIRAEPKWDTLPANLHPRLRELVERCLEKQVGERFQDIGDVKVDLQRILADSAGVIVEPVVEAADVRQAPPQSKLVRVAAIVLGIAGAGLAGWYLRPAPPTGPVVRLAHVLPEGDQLTRTGRSNVAVSSDGTKIVYVANRQLYLRDLGELEARPIQGTNANPSDPFFSPTGDWVGYFSSTGVTGQLMKIPVGGGVAVVVVGVTNFVEVPSWLADETIVYGQPEGIMRVSANGGTPELLIAGPGLASPEILANDYLLFSQTGSEGDEVVVQSLRSEESNALFSGSNPRYVPTGQIVYQVDDVLFAVGFDVDSLEVTGGPVALLEGVGFLHWALSDSGSLVYVPGAGVETQRPLVWVVRNGVSETIDTIPPADFEAPRLSPDEDRVLLVDDGDVWIYEIATGRRSPVTTDGSVNNEAEWSPTGQDVAFSSQRAGFALDVFVKPADGSGEARQLSSLDGTVEVDSWSPNDDVLMAHHHSPEGPQNLLAIQVGEEASEPQGFLVREFNDNGAMFSPDGRYVVYVSDESGQREVYIRPYPGPGSQTTVSVGGGTEPVWRDGELFYRRSADDQMMAVSVTTEPELEVGEITELFLGDYFGFGTPPRPDYDVTADRNRFLMIAEESSSSGQFEVIIVQNWFEELKERVPVP